MTDHPKPQAEAAVVAQLARAAAVKTIDITDDYLNPILVIAGEGGAQRVVDLQDYAELPRPSATRRATVYDPASLAAYTTRYSRLNRARLIHDPQALTVTAIIDDDGWRAHTCTLALEKTIEWKEWLAVDGSLMDQQRFAEFIEGRLTDFLTPTGADMLEVAQTFEASEQARWVSGTRLSSGETRLVYEQSIEAKAGTSGVLDVPSHITIGVEPFQGAGVYQLGARFRYRLKQGGIVMGLALDRPHDVARLAFTEMSNAIREELAGWLHVTGSRA